MPFLPPKQQRQSTEGKTIDKANLRRQSGVDGEWISAVDDGGRRRRFGRVESRAATDARPRRGAGRPGREPAVRRHAAVQLGGSVRLQRSIGAVDAAVLDVGDVCKQGRSRED